MELTSDQIKRYAQRHTKDSFLLRDDVPDGWHENGRGEWHYYKDGERKTTTPEEAEKQ